MLICTLYNIAGIEVVIVILFRIDVNKIIELIMRNSQITDSFVVIGFDQ
jgi:hypothetical protein